MEDFTIDIMLDKGPNARSIQLNLNQFTLVGATTRLGNLTSPMRDRFGVVLRLDFYEEKDLLEIITRSAKILEIKMQEDGAAEIAGRSRGTPRIANRILRRARDFAQIKSNGVITLDVAKSSLNRLGIDAQGLDDMDRRILTALVEKLVKIPAKSPGRSMTGPEETFIFTFISFAIIPANVVFPSPGGPNNKT